MIIIVTLHNQVLENTSSIPIVNLPQTILDAYLGPAIELCTDQPVDKVKAAAAVPRHIPGNGGAQSGASGRDAPHARCQGRGDCGARAPTAGPRRAVTLSSGPAVGRRLDRRSDRRQLAAGGAKRLALPPPWPMPGRPRSEPRSRPRRYHGRRRCHGCRTMATLRSWSLTRPAPTPHLCGRCRGLGCCEVSAAAVSRSLQ